MNNPYLAEIEQQKKKDAFIKIALATIAILAIAGSGIYLYSYKTNLATKNKITKNITNKKSKTARKIPARSKVTKKTKAKKESQPLKAKNKQTETKNAKTNAKSETNTAIVTQNTKSAEVVGNTKEIKVAKSEKPETTYPSADTANDKSEDIADSRDTLYLRYGRRVKGKIVFVNKDSYTFQKQEINLASLKEKAEKNNTPTDNTKTPRTRSLSIRIPKQAVKHIVYGETDSLNDITKKNDVLKFYDQKISKKLSSENNNNNTGNNIKSKNTKPEITFLPTKPFGERLLEEIKKAQKSIYITTYYLHSPKHEPLKTLFDVISEKIKQGVDVRIIMAQDAGTSDSVRTGNLKTAKELLENNIKINYSHGGKVMHKKMWIIDEERAFVGSSNVSYSSLTLGNNVNVLVKDKKFIQYVLADFYDLWENTKKLY